MISDDDKAKIRFDLANANVQSIGRAQGLYVTALLTYICLVWGLFFVGSSEISFHVGWLDLKVDGIWRITPFVLLVLTLAYIGSLTAMSPALACFREAEKELFGSHEHSLFQIDTHKNLIDYLAILQLRPWGQTYKPQDDSERTPVHRRFHNLILPVLFVGSAFTSFWAIHKLSAIHPRRAESMFGWCCLGLQIAFSLRPIRRFGWRIFASETSDVYK